MTSMRGKWSKTNKNQNKKNREKVKMSAKTSTNCVIHSQEESLEKMVKLYSAILVKLRLTLLK